MQILVTGGTGYIASHVAVELVENGHLPVLYDNLSNSKIEVAQAIAQICGKDIPFIKGDIRDRQQLTEAITTHNCDAVMHFAGLKAVGESVEQPLTYFDNNISGSICLLAAVRQTGINKLIFSSSATVYGDPQYLPLDESHPTSAVNPYGRSKLHIEELLADCCTSQPNLGVVCLRYFNPVGAHPSSLIGENPAGTPNNLMPYIAQTAAGWHKQVQVFGKDYDTTDGTGVRDYIHILDLVAGHTVALAWLADDRTGWHAVNLGTGRGYSVLDAIQAFSHASGKEIPHSFAPRRSGDVASCYASVDKAKAMLGWKARHDLAAMCQSAWQWQQKLDLAL